MKGKRKAKEKKRAPGRLSFEKLKNACQSKQLDMQGSTCLWLILTIWHLLQLPPFVFSTMKWFCVPAFSPSFLLSLNLMRSFCPSSQLTPPRGNSQRRNTSVQMAPRRVPGMGSKHVHGYRHSPEALPSPLPLI